eukprot:3730316-Prymnesium_polylepis.2
MWCAWSTTKAFDWFGVCVESAMPHGMGRARVVFDEASGKRLFTPFGRPIAQRSALRKAAPRSSASAPRARVAHPNVTQATSAHAQSSAAHITT